MSVVTSHLLTSSPSRLPFSWHEEARIPCFLKMALQDASLPSSRLAGFLTKVAFLTPNSLSLDLLAVGGLTDDTGRRAPNPEAT